MDVKSLSQIGPYQVERFVDAGAFAWVFEVRDPKFVGRRLALKMLMPSAAEGTELRRFEAEARLLAQIDHPNVVTIFDFGRDDVTGNFYYVMTFVQGPTLKSHLKQGPLSVDEALPLFVDLLDGLARIHDNGIVHRDIKPANVLLGQDGRPRLADLGIARVQHERSQTGTGIAVGTALYMSPEQARGREVDPRSDLFSLGLTLYQCLTGQVIYDHVDSIDSSSGMDVLLYIGSLVHTHREFDIRFGSDTEIPEVVRRIILKSLRLNPADRYANAREMRDVLRAAIAELRGGPPASRASAHAPSRLVSGIAAGVAALLLVVAIYVFYWGPRQDAAEQAARAEAGLIEASALAESALAVASAVRDLEPAVPSELLERIDEHVDRGDRYVEDLANDVKSGGYAVALRNLERGREQYLAACQIVNGEVLAARVEATVGALRERVARLTARGAVEVVPTAWNNLAAALAPIEAPATAESGCALARSDFAKLRAAADAAPQVDIVARDLDDEWPRLIDAAYEQASTARMVAVAVPSEASEYRLAIREAKRFLLQGSRHRRADEPQAARNAYRQAELGFQVAARIAPAAESRATATALAQEIAADNGTAIGEIAQTLEDGDAAYASQRWEHAEAQFQQAIAALKELRQATEWRREAVAASAAAATARTEAIRSGAQSSAPTDFAQAEATLTGAQRALEAEDPKQAELGFAMARDQFGAARKRAIRALRDATLTGAGVTTAGEDLLGSGRCADLEVEAGRADCTSAESERAAGEAAIEDLDAPAAMRHFMLAQESYARAKSTQTLWQATRPRPPVLVRRVPQRSTVEASPRQLYSFGVEAQDPNGDILHYRWTIDGEVQEDVDGPTLKRRLERDASIAVTVDDGRGGELHEEWQVQIVDRKAAR